MTIQLLTREIDLEPGRPPLQPPVDANVVGKGSARLRLFNETDQENAFTVRIECNDPYWQEDWVTLASMPPMNPPKDPGGKPIPTGIEASSLKRDVMGAGGHSIRSTRVPAGMVRDIVLNFAVDQTPQARCGVYRFRVIVEVAIGSGSGTRRSIAQGDVIVRPFYKFSAEVKPGTQTVGRFRRSREYDLEVKNEGNDWLCLEVRVPRAKDAIVSTKTTRIAVPPPEPGGDSYRRVPFVATTNLKTIIGVAQPQLLNLTVVRGDAPSVPPLAAQALTAPVGSGSDSAVLYAPTSDPIVFEPPTLIYRPIPRTLTGAGQFIVANAKGLIMGAIALIVGTMMAVMLLGAAWNSTTKISVLRGNVGNGGVLPLGGNFLEGVEAVLIDPDTKEPKTDPIPVHFGKGEAGIALPELTQGWIRIPPEITNARCKITFRRKFPIPLPSFITKSWEKPQSDITIGQPSGKGSQIADIYVGQPGIVITQDVTGMPFDDSASAKINGKPLTVVQRSSAGDSLTLKNPDLTQGTVYVVVSCKRGTDPVTVTLTVNPTPQSPTSGVGPEGGTAGGTTGITGGPVSSDSGGTPSNAGSDPAKNASTAQGMNALQEAVNGGPEQSDAALQAAGSGPIAAVVKDMIDVKKKEALILPATDSGGKLWRSEIDPLYGQAFEDANNFSQVAAKLVAEAAAASARRYGTEVRAKEWDGMASGGN